MRQRPTPHHQRPDLFWRGYNLYDPVNLGFISHGQEAKSLGTRYDTTQRAAGNQGHAFGTELSPADKDALIEYLKTL
jgi:hypothetical protein